MELMRVIKMHPVKEARHKLIEALDQIRNDCNNILIGVEIIETNLFDFKTIKIKSIEEGKEGINTYSSVLDDSIEDLEKAIKEYKECLTLQEIEK